MNGGGASRLRCRLAQWATCLLAGLSWMAGVSVAAPAAVERVSPCFVTPPKGSPAKFKYDCGYVTVPEDRAAPGGRVVKLGFLRLRSAAPRKGSPLFMLAGGPGSSLIRPEVFLLLGPGFLGPVLEDRDVVILDQRGTRHSVPFLDCPDFHGLAWATYSQGLSEEAGNGLRRWSLERCVREFRRKGIDLSNFNSVAIAADIDDARKALGYERIVYYGASYGSQLGQHVMRDYPGMLEAVVLDGTNSLSRKSWIEDRALDADFALRHLSELCGATPGCREAYDIPSLVERGLAIFDDGPLPASYADPGNPGTTLKFTVRREDFVGLVYEKMGYKVGVSSLPYLLKLLVEGGRRSMSEVLGDVVGQKLVAARGASSGAMAVAMHLAVVCSDDPVRSVDELVVDGVSRYAELFGRAAALEYVESCGIVGVRSLPDSTDVDVTAGIPTLILSGGLDAATPTFRSEVVARSLPNARLVVFADGTHVQIGAANVCAAQIMSAFVRDPKGPLPMECAGKLRFPGFMLPDGTVGR
jgi:pimeloyl-ACP methyl ester carboxylesterase